MFDSVFWQQKGSKMKGFSKSNSLIARPPLGKSFQTPFGGSKVFLKGPCPGMEIPEISEISDISDLSDISEIFWNADLQMIRNGHPKFYRVLSICFLHFHSHNFFRPWRWLNKGQTSPKWCRSKTGRWDAILIDFDRFWSISMVFWCCLMLFVVGNVGDYEASCDL